MYRTHQMKSRKAGTTRNLGILASVVMITACAEAPQEPVADDNLASAKDSLLVAACSTAGGNLTMAVAAGEVGYVGRVAGCTTEPCVFANALDATGAICRINSSTGTITVTGSGSLTEKFVVDYSNGLFAQATTATPMVSVTLHTGSTLMVIAPTAGGNMALGATGLDSNTLLARGTPRVDVAMTGVDFMFNGGAGKDVFTADAAGWTTAPTGWATSATIASAVGAASALTLTISGGANDDTLAGGAGINTLLGGAGNDTFVQSTLAHAEDMKGGDGIDTVDYGVRAAPVFVTVGKNAAVATATLGATGTGGTGYVVGDVLSVACKVAPATFTVATLSTSAVATFTNTSPGVGCAVATNQVTTGGTGTGATINVATLAADDGAALEGDNVRSDIEIIKGGAGNDILTAYPILTTDVVLIGNAGNDILTGGGGNDDICGGAGDDTFPDNAGNDNIVGGAGLDTIDYTGSTAAVTACLNSADVVVGRPCAVTNGQLGEKDVVNNAALLKVCPRATLTADVGGTPTAAVAVPAASQGGPMVVDVENLTGHAVTANALYCGTLACTLFGGAGADTLAGGASSDIIIGFGGSDTVTTNGGNDLVDLTNATGGYTQTVDCAGNAVTILVSSADTKAFNANCSNANTP
jgi:Ca2+-binding RTX toxin-like protein